MDSKPAPLASWPWKFLGTYKYWLYVPLASPVLLKVYRGEPFSHDYCFLILLLSLLRCCIYECWHALSRSNLISNTRAIQQVGVGFEQVDREFDWDNYMILQALIAAAIAYTWNCGLVIAQMPLWSWKGMVIVMILHMGPTEFAYYYIHRVFHGNLYMFRKYHSLHHASTRPEPSTAGTATFLEHLVLTLLMALPIAGVFLIGHASVGIIFAYVLGFDFLRNMIHSNIETVPVWPFELLPLLRYLLITPSYHSLHHSLGEMNYCLFMPFYDYLGGTLNKTAFQLHADLRKKGNKVRVPDSVFLVHGVDFLSSLHVGLVSRTYSSVPRQTRWWALIFVPCVIVGLLVCWIWGKAYVYAQYTFKGIRHQSWSLPRIGLQYFLPNGYKNINKLIEETILEADRMGVKVLTLGALNKNEAMNGGGALFVNKYPNLKVRVCHGNTLTTAVILRELPTDVKEVFLTGSTSKIGKAIALYLCRKRVRVLMLTASEDRFNALVKEAPKEFQQYLVRATKYQAGQNCKVWILGKWAGWNAQKLAPPGTRFHQFTLPPVLHFRSDCAYFDSAGIRLPDKFVQGVCTCDHTMPRNVMYACHAGGLIHALEGWQHHEVGAVDVEQIDIVWEAAMKHGLTQV